MNNVITLKRTIKSNKGILGQITLEGNVIHTLERPWDNNKQNVSCIPAGEYAYEVRFSSKWKRKVVWLYNVPSRSAIQIHVGNRIKDSLGCILVGLRMLKEGLEGEPQVLDSVKAMDLLISLIPEKGVLRVSD